MWHACGKEGVQGVAGKSEGLKEHLIDLGVGGRIHWRGY